MVILLLTLKEYDPDITRTGRDQLFSPAAQADIDGFAQKLLQSGKIKRQHPQVWAPVNKESASSDFGELELEGAYFLVLSLTQQDEDDIHFVIHPNGEIY